jgi:hypothetical protein
VPDGPYIPEEQIADWTSLGIRDFFTRAGYRVVTYRPTQRLERDLPADRVYLDIESGKVFGLQYKPLYHNGEDYWPVDDQQHDTLRHFPWIFYCCSELIDVSEHGIALDYARVYRPRFRYRDRIVRSRRRSPRPISWSDFFAGLKRCRYGKKLWRAGEFSVLLTMVEGLARQRQTQQMYELFVVELERKAVFVPVALPSASQAHS